MIPLILVCVVLASWLHPYSARAAAAAVFHLHVEPQSTEELHVIVEGQQLSDVYAYEVYLAYDASKLRFVSADSSVQGFGFVGSETEGNVSYALTKVGSTPGMNGQAELARFVFAPIAPGQTEIRLYKAELVDSDIEKVSLTLDVRALAGDRIAFTDIAGHWAEQQIIQAVGKGWVTGYPDGTFKPQSQVTRAEFAAMLVRGLDQEHAATPPPFSDVIPAWASDAVAAAVEAGYIQGYADGTFRANQPISRPEIAAMVARAAGLELPQEAVLSFADAGDVPGWAVPHIAAAVDAGMVQGRGNNRFAPLEQATRAEAVTLLLKLF
ncbi:S-layer homology domain-containing protein [Paenibacillus daejeonensis]|uniref:S-layer homology domain-containing protein n=1 Tax=Paenibacillus daejeonensis TaxID=135193 RepID=UPI000371229C|nr:S-layer homology domain-containing protein [Paenibacillus daejeonensis]